MKLFLMRGTELLVTERHKSKARVFQIKIKRNVGQLAMGSMNAVAPRSYCDDCLAKEDERGIKKE
jgi:hypothetical protein